MDLNERMAAYAAELRRDGAIRSDPVERAFATVPRHRFLSEGGFYRSGQHHTLGDPPAEELLDLIYANTSLFTHSGRDGDPTSSSSSPALMATMLEALDLQPGMRVLEIGGGTGYNAALITAITGAEVTTVEAGQRAATHAAAALAELGLNRVRLEHADGYAGDPAGQRYDRIMATCGIAGIPPGWLDQLTDTGRILAPIAHAGIHPLVALTRDRGRLVGSVVQSTDFMPAAGDLRPAALFPHDPRHRLPARDVQHHPAHVAPLGTEQYRDLTFYLGVRDERITRAVLDHESFSAACGTTALVEHDSAAWIQQDGTTLHTGPEPTATHLHNRLLAVVEDWHHAQQPSIPGWRSEFDHGDDLDPPLLRPRRWHTRDDVEDVQGCREA